MGTYLSTPVTEKGEEEGTCTSPPMNWGVVDMQGWRKSMEDAHVASTEVPVPFGEESTSHAQVFGVFDGHGGPEVARFVQVYLVDVLTKQPTWVGPSEDPVASPVGQALVDAFHALDRMIDDDSRRDELIRLRTEKPNPGEARIAQDIPPPPPDEPHPTAVVHDTIPEEEQEEEDESKHVEMKDMSVVQEEEKEEKDSVVNGVANTLPEETDETSDQVSESRDDSNDIAEPKLEESTSVDTKETPSEDAKEESPPSNKEDVKEEQSSDDTNVQQEPSLNGQANEAPSSKDAASDATDVLPATKQEPATQEDAQKPAAVTDEDESEATEDDDSEAVVGKDEAAALDRDMLDDEDETKEEDTKESVNSGKVGIMLQRILSLGGGGGSGQVSISADQDTSDGTRSSSAREITPTIVQNGRPICNLPDHPIHAGCTAVVAVLIGRKLTVANAGDSRAVLCRAGGRCEALSFDHKPQQHREMDRITKAGGFVNQFGRVNGNLNLSRSVGDLKYKQVPGIHPSGQMITAEPDLVEVYLNAGDEFLLLGCDGIWDCLSNAQAIKYVRDRIDTMTPTQIGAEMLDEIISEDPRSTQGIGGDNMTIMIVDLKPEKRSYYASSGVVE